MVTEKIAQIRRLRQQRIQANRNEEEWTRPMKHDLSEIPEIYERFKEVCNPKCADNKHIFILIVVFMYSPISFADDHICRNGVRKRIAKVLGLKECSISVYFGIAKSLINNHSGFRNEVERVYGLICDAPLRHCQDETP